MKKTMRQEIVGEMLAELDAHKIEDTLENRIAFLTGMQMVYDAKPTSLDEVVYRLALNDELFATKLKKIAELFV